MKTTIAHARKSLGLAAQRRDVRLSLVQRCVRVGSTDVVQMERLFERTWHLESDEGQDRKVVANLKKLDERVGPVARALVPMVRSARAYREQGDGVFHPDYVSPLVMTEADADEEQDAQDQEDVERQTRDHDGQDDDDE
jgi:hypothetical protein